MKPKPTPDCLNLVQNRDRYRLIRQWQQLQRSPAKQEASAKNDADDTASDFARWQASVDKSIAKVESRQAAVPTIEYPEGLPIADKREQIQAALAEHQVVIVAGETGSGKTTQLPKMCLELGRGCKGLIGHTQPRRIAARTVASRIADELNVELGSSVGYQVRFTDHSGPNTHIKLMTDGILLAEIQNDRFLSRYDTLIIDEAHERSLNIDFLLGYLKSILPKRPDLKIIVTSATIDVERFSKHFNDAPIVEVSGRTYPVSVHYRPLPEDDADINRGIIEAVEEILDWEKAGKTPSRGGDFLVFMSGERDIREAALALRKADLPHLEILPLYARLSLAEQDKIFKKQRGRRIVLATNVAETSLTVPGIGYVIDPGLARVSRYSVRTKVQRLPIERISQASANQRMGRCGRISEGICVRLFSEEDFTSRPEFTEAEILRTNLAAVILQMLHLRIGDIRSFPFVDAPDSRLINDGYQLLQTLQAVNDQDRLSSVGKQLSRLPLDPRLGRILLAAVEHNCLREVLIIVSALSVQDPRERPAEKKQAADEKHRRFHEEGSDFLAFVNLWQYAEEQRQDLSQNQFRKQLSREFLSYLRLREWRDIHHQLRLAIKPLEFKENTEPASFDSIHKALLVGLLDYVGTKTEERDYLGTRQRKFVIFPGSALNKKSPRWIAAAQLLETSRLFAHTVAKIEPEWVLEASRHLVKRHYSEPHYDGKRGQVMAYERITLFGLTLVERQRVNYSHLDPEVAREVFIRSALVEGRYTQAAARNNKGPARNAKNTTNSKAKGSSGNTKVGAFFQHNQKLVAELEGLEAKSRRRDILVDEQVIFDFYAERIPKQVVNRTSFETWRQKQEQEKPKLLYLDRETLMQSGALPVTEAQFPNQIECGGMVLPLRYHFEPGSVNDGVSVRIPVPTLHQLPEARLEWLVPGMLRDKAIAMVKGLPKQWRKNFVPVPAYVDKCLQAMLPDNIPLHEALAKQLLRQTGVKIPDDAWQEVTVDDYYRMNIQLVDDRGKLIEQSRDLARLKVKFRDQVQQTLQDAGESLERDGITQWDFGELAKQTQLKRHGIRIQAFPALVDQGDSVALKMHDNPQEAENDSLRGIVRLAMLQNAETVKYLRKELLKGKDIGLAVTDLGNRQQVVDDIIAAAIRQTSFPDALPREPQQFEQAINATKTQWVGRAQAIEKLLLDVLKTTVGIKKTLKSQKNALMFAYAASDIKQQISGLLFPGFLYSTQSEWLQEYPRYFQAIAVRMEKVPLQVQKDKVMIAQVQPFWTQYETLVNDKGRNWADANVALQQFRWMLEEFRVSLFAQTLRTKLPVSDKRLQKQWQMVLENG